MQRANVVGTATASIKHESMNGSKLLVVQPLLASGNADGYPLIAIDTVGAGIGQQVILTSDGRFSREFLNHESNPVRYTIIGIEDSENGVRS